MTIGPLSCLMWATTVRLVWVKVSRLVVGAAVSLETLVLVMKVPALALARTIIWMVGLDLVVVKVELSLATAVRPSVPSPLGWPTATAWMVLVLVTSRPVNDTAGSWWAGGFGTASAGRLFGWRVGGGRGG